MMEEFDQAQYWIDRHKRLVGDPRSVGHLGRTVEQNRQSEMSIIKVVDKLAKDLLPAKTVLDLGCGYGRISNCFTNLKYHYIGLDVSKDAIDQARSRNPYATFEAVDLTNWSYTKQFDVVLALYIFVHIVDDYQWQIMLERVLSTVNKGGVFVIADVFPSHRETTAKHAVSRTWEEYLPYFDNSGFELDSKFFDDNEELKRLAKHFRVLRKL